MGMNSPTHYEYVAYIDESGDTGLRRVKPLDVNGASEWMIVCAVVIQRGHEAYVSRWVQDICRNFKGYQRFGFHFKDLNPAKRRLVCATMATKPLRIFVVASNKKNMRGYENPWAERIPSNNWFYCWLTRLLLERVTHFVLAKSLAKFGESRFIKLEYSNRGGLSDAQMGAYYTWLGLRSSAGRLFLPLGDLCWDVMHPTLLTVFEHNSRAGLHLADAASSASFKAMDKYDTGGCDPEFAKLLHPRMGRIPDTRYGRISGWTEVDARVRESRSRARSS
jgi:hypothetical protein